MCPAGSTLRYDTLAIFPVRTGPGASSASMTDEIQAPEPHALENPVGENLPNLAKNFSNVRFSELF